MADVDFRPLPLDGRSVSISGAAGALDAEWSAYHETREALRARPGEWARIAVGRSASAATTMKRRPSWLGFEIKCRGSVDVPGRWDIYARWVGGAA